MAGACSLAVGVGGEVGETEQRGENTEEGNRTNLPQTGADSEAI